MSDKVSDILDEVATKIEVINRDLERIMPRATIKAVSSFGNSGHVVLSKSFVDKKIGIIVLDDYEDEIKLRKMKGGQIK